MTSTSATIEFPYKPSIGSHVFGMVFFAAFSVFLIWPALRDYHGDASGFYDYFMTRTPHEKKDGLFAVLSMLYAIFCLGRLPSMLSAGEMAVLRIAPDGVTLPAGYFEVRQVFIASDDITNVSRYRTRNGERIRLYHKDGSVLINKPWLPDNAAFEQVWLALQRFKKLQ